MSIYDQLEKRIEKLENELNLNKLINRLENLENEVKHIKAVLQYQNRKRLK